MILDKKCPVLAHFLVKNSAVKLTFMIVTISVLAKTVVARCRLNCLFTREDVVCGSVESGLNNKNTFLFFSFLSATKNIYKYNYLVPWEVCFSHGVLHRLSRVTEL